MEVMGKENYVSFFNKRGVFSFAVCLGHLAQRLDPKFMKQYEDVS